MSGRPETRTPGTTPANADHTDDDGIVTQREAQRKAFATVQAQAALAGWQLHQVTRFYVLRRWNGDMEMLPSLNAVDEFLQRVGARA